MRKKETEHETKEKDFDYDEELQKYFDKYGNTLETSFLQFMVKSELSDMIFQQHQMSCHLLNFWLVGVQIIMVIVSCISLIYGLKISNITAAVNITILVAIALNNSICTKAWNKSRKRLDTTSIGIDLLPVKAKLEILKELENEYGINFEQLSKNKNDEE